MLRGVIIFMMAVLTSACASMVDGVQQAAQAKIQQLLAHKFGQQLADGIDWVVNDLGREGGFLDDPLVRILLPPPLGLVIDVAQDLNADPKAALLETLLNRAAENAIPVAGPILKNMITNMDDETLTQLVNSPREAATLYLKEKGGDAIKQALLPAVAESLHANGAIELYGGLLQAQRQANVAAKAVEDAQGQMAVVESVAPDQLGNYVAEQAVGGLFRKMAVKEKAIRDDLDRSAEHPLGARLDLGL